jgi:alkyldihydroxyacetonephosphate synthase
MTSTPLRDAQALIGFLTEMETTAPEVSIDQTLEERASHAKDRWPEVDKWSAEELEEHLPLAVVRPSTAQQVSATVAAAAAAGVAVIPYGGGSGVVGGVVGVASFISIDLRSLSAEPAFDDDRGEVRVPAGVLGSDLERLANARGRRIPHYPQSLFLATVGGLVATRSSGTFSTKYGSIEDLVVGLEVVLGDGRIIHTKPVPRSAAGPSITQLFIGSEGAFGIITEVTLRTIPIAPETRFRGIAFPGIRQALDALRAVFDNGITPAVTRIYDPVEATNLYGRARIAGSGRALLILAFDGHPDVVAAEEAATLGIAAAGGGTDLGSEIGEIWERTRFDASWLDQGNSGDTLLADAIEVSASWPDLAELHANVLAALTPIADTVYAHYSHFYANGGALYIIFFVSGADREEALAKYRDAWAATLGEVLALSGSISHHHGVGEARKNWMGAELGDAMSVLRAVKTAIDPRSVLNPGKLGLLEGTL